MMGTVKNKFLGILVVCSLSTSVFAITPTEIPGTVNPGVISKTLQEQGPTQSLPTGSLVQAPRGAGPTTLSPEAAKIKFKLVKIVLEGNHVYSENCLLPLYQDKLNQVISIADLMKIVQSITNYYRNQGYILSRAILPPQHVQNGIVRVRVLEGYIDKVIVDGQPDGARALIQCYTNHIARCRPLRIGVLEHYMRLANLIPDVRAKAVLEPSKNAQGAATLHIVSDAKKVSGYVAYDNYGSRYIGPNEITFSGAINSIFRSGDATRLTYVTSSRLRELRYWDLYYDAPLNSEGLRLTFDATESQTHPVFVLQPLNVEGKSNIYSLGLTFPYILSRCTDLILNASFNYIDDGSKTFGNTIYNDHIRTLRAGGVLNHTDGMLGLNSFSAEVEQGLLILGASNDPNSPTSSRPGATGDFTKFDLQASRLQPLGNSIFSTFVVAKGQYSFNPLLAYEQFTFGGSVMGRGYDSADLIGDEGLGGSVELRAALPLFCWMQSFEPYIFYDIGAIWNKENVLGTPSKQSESSAGVGVRFFLAQHVSGNLLLAQPLSKQDTAEQLAGNGRSVRGLFSLTVEA